MMAGDDFENELQSSVSAFEALERDFQEVNQNNNVTAFTTIGMTIKLSMMMR